MSLTIAGCRPVNLDHGVYQGVPIARFYVDRFLERLAPSVSGDVLEFGHPTYAARLSCRYDILDIDGANRQATIVGDICDPRLAERVAARFDFVIATAVLQLVDDPRAAARNLHALLRPGGVLIAAEKCVSKIDSWFGPVDRWRFTPNGLRHLLAPFSRVEVESFGNIYAICAYLQGIPASQVEADKLAHSDPEHPLVAAAYAEK
jgi:SAM-dependent methyltransferase